MVLIPSCAVQHNAGKTCCQASVSVAGVCGVPPLLLQARACLARVPPWGGCGRCPDLAVASLSWAQSLELLPGVLGTTPRNGIGQRISTPGQQSRAVLWARAWVPNTTQLRRPGQAAVPGAPGVGHRDPVRGQHSHCHADYSGNCASFWGELHRSQEGLTLQLVPARPSLTGHRGPDVRMRGPGAQRVCRVELHFLPGSGVHSAFPDPPGP